MSTERLRIGRQITSRFHSDGGGGVRAARARGDVAGCSEYEADCTANRAMVERRPRPPRVGAAARLSALSAQGRARRQWPSPAHVAFVALTPPPPAQIAE